jgi:hypothetical protein
LIDMVRLIAINAGENPVSQLGTAVEIDRN